MKALKSMFALATIAVIVGQTGSEYHAAIEPRNPVPRLLSNPEIRRVLVPACGDCHSNHTDWPWYSQVAPVSWWIAPLAEGHLAVWFADRVEKIIDKVFRRKHPPISRNSEWTLEFIRYMANEATKFGADFSVVFLPGARAMYYVDVDMLKRSAANVSFVDLDGEASALDLYPSQTIPDGHYKSRLAAFLGSKIGTEICNRTRAAHAYTTSHSCQTPVPGCER